MKTKQIEMSLNDIKEEDQMTLSEKKAENEELKRKIAFDEKKIECIKKEIEDIEYLDNINKNIFKYFHIIAPMVEIPAMALCLFAPISQQLTPSSIIISSVTALALAIDTVVVDCMYYKNLSNKDNIFSRMIESIKKSAKSEKRMNKERNRAELRLLCAEDELQSTKNTYAKNKEEISMLEEELSYIEGALIGIGTMLSKYSIDDVPEHIEIVEYVNKKRILTKKDA